MKTGPFVTATFNELQVKCLIDMVAQVSAMSKDIYKQIKQDGIEMKIQSMELQLV